jgi:hypothetical protein
MWITVAAPKLRHLADVRRMVQPVSWESARGRALAPDGRRLLVTNFASGQLEAVNVPSIP